MTSQADLVSIQRALDQLLGPGHDFLAAALEHAVQLAAADDLADRALADFPQRLLRLR